MADARPDTITETLRGRLLRGIQAGTLEPGSRLPSARELVAEFGIDHRLILAAYRQLASEGLVEIRERGGVYVSAASETIRGRVAPPASWLVDTLADAYAHEIPATALHEWLRRVTETLRLRAVVISTTEDQVAGLARELRDDFGFTCEGVTGNQLVDPVVVTGPVERADVILTTVAYEEPARTLGERSSKPVIILDVRPDLAVGEWTLLLRQPVWAIVATREFGEMLTHFFRDVKGAENLRVLVHGEDDLSEIPDGAPTYVTHRVRQALGETPIRGRVLPPARTISSASARSIFEFVVATNMGALRALPAAIDQYSAERRVNDSTLAKALRSDQ